MPCGLATFASWPTRQEFSLTKAVGSCRRLGEELVRAKLREVLAVVLAYAQELVGVRDRRQVADRALVEHRAGALCRALEHRWAAGEEVLHAARAQVDDPGTLEHADVRRRVVTPTKADKTHAACESGY
jgi:hypothetical protein